MTQPVDYEQDPDVQVTPIPEQDLHIVEVDDDYHPGGE